MSKTVIMLGRHGDVISILPLLYALSQKGERNKLMVGSEFASVMDGVGYVEPLVFHGKIADIKQAAYEAGKDAIVAQVYGRFEDVKEMAFGRAGVERTQTDSFTKEAWRLAGHFDLWKTVPPLVFDKRDKVREDALVAEHIKSNKRVILLSLSGKTSPFPYPELCKRLLELEFGRRKGWQIVDISNLKAGRIYDLLALYEKAHVLVASDSAPLHLAAACPNLPVVALVNDKPNYWHGSPWKPNHIWHCRYGVFAPRATEMLEAIQSISDVVV